MKMCPANRHRPLVVMSFLPGFLFFPLWRRLFSGLSLIMSLSQASLLVAVWAVEEENGLRN